MKRWLTKLACVSGVFLFTLWVSAPAAHADAPLQEGPFSFPFTIDDFFAGSGQSCNFPVLGSWDVTLNQTTYYYPGTEQAARIVTDVEFDGTLSNPLSGESVPDASHHDMVTDYYASDGTYLKTVENESRDDPLLRADFHTVFDANVTFADDGRDWLPTATVVVDIAPLCDALS